MIGGCAVSRIAASVLRVQRSVLDAEHRLACLIVCSVPGMIRVFFFGAKLGTQTPAVF